MRVFRISTELARIVEFGRCFGLTVEENLRLMKTLDDAWNGQDWETFMKRHAENVAVYWPGQPEPTGGRHAHHLESVGFFKAVENHIENDPYMILFGRGLCLLCSKMNRHPYGPFEGS